MKREFRWKYVDDSLGEQWSEWHAAEGECPACCCDGPRLGHHFSAAAFYDQDGYLEWGAHVELDPDHPMEWEEVEWRG